VKFMAASAATEGVTNISCREKLSHTEIYASGSGHHHRCPICFLSREKNSPTWKSTVSTVCVLMTRDLLVVA